MASGTEEPASEGDWTLVMSEDETDKDAESMDTSAAVDTEQKEGMEKASNDGSEQTAGKDKTSENDDDEEGEKCSLKEDGIISDPALTKDEKELSKDADVSVPDEVKANDEKKDETCVKESHDVSHDTGCDKPSDDQNVKSSSDLVVDAEVDKDIENEDEHITNTRDESFDSDSTIIMDSIDGKTPGDDDASESKEITDDNKDETVTEPGTGDGVKSKEQISHDNQDKNVEKMIRREGSTKVATKGEEGSTIRITDKKKSRVESAVSEGSPTAKKTAQQETFRSFDLPIHPVNEARRSRARQRSEEHPLERSSSVASNRSEDSSGTGSYKQRKKVDAQVDTAQHDKRRKMVRPGFDFKAGFRLEAQDFNDKWYPAKIVEVDDDDLTVLIHFNGWNSRFDEWMNYKSDRIRPAPRKEISLEKMFTIGDTVLARWSDTRYYQGKIRGVNPNGSYRVKFYDGLEKSVQAGNIREMPEELRPIVSPKGYGIGDEVLARWNDCRYYPAKILSIKKNGAFRVLFYDGIEKSVQPFNVREMSAELKAQEFFKQFKAQIRASEEKNRKKEKRKREEAAEAEGSSPPPHQPKRRPFSPTSSQPKRVRHDSADSSKTISSSISGDKDVSPESDKSHKTEQHEDLQTEVEYEVEKVVLQRGVGYYVDKFIYLKHRDTGSGFQLRCQNRSPCYAKAIIKKENGKAVVKYSKHTHAPPLFKNIVFCTTEDDALIPSTQGAPPSSEIEAKDTSAFIIEDITPLSEMLPPEELEKIKERRKHIREHVLIDSSLGVLRNPQRIAAPKELIIDLDHNKYKCEVPDCGKSFRKATLLEYHKKYYHVKQATPSVTAAAASKVLSKSRKRLATSPTQSSSRRSSEETTTPAKVTRSQRSSAPSELGATSPTRPPMSPPLRSPSDRRRSGDAQRRERREKSGDRTPEARVAAPRETRSPVDTKGGKIPETRIPKSPDPRMIRSSDGKFMRTPEGRSSRSLSAESARSSDSKTSPASESRRRRPSAPERTRKLSGAAATKSTEVIVEIPAPEEQSVDSKEPKVCNKDTKIDSKSTSKKSEEVMVVRKDINKETNKVPEAKSLTDDNVVIKQETLGVDGKKKMKEPAEKEQQQKEPKVAESTTKQEVKLETVASTEVSAAAVSTSNKAQTKPEVKVVKDREKVVKDRDGKSRSDRAKVKHKKKHKHKHDKSKEERSRDRHKAERRRKASEKSKVSDVEGRGKEKSSMDVVKREAIEASHMDVTVEETYADAVIALDEGDMIEEEKELINCVCGYMEEEGFMLQCERCYCWQHGCCEGVNQSTAPRHYVCTFCRHPRGERVQSKYRYDQEWFDTGKLPKYKYICQDDIPDTSPTMLTTHNLMADVHTINEVLHGLQHKMAILKPKLLKGNKRNTINEVLHGLQHKMAILKNPNHPELALWAHPWRHGEEWSFDGHQHSDHMDTSADHMDTSAQDTDLSHMDSSNLDTVPNSLNVSMQSFEGADVVRMDTGDVVDTNDGGIKNQEESHDLTGETAGSSAASKETDVEKTPAAGDSNVGDAMAENKASSSEMLQADGEITGETKQVDPVEEKDATSQKETLDETHSEPEAKDVPLESTAKTDSSTVENETVKDTENVKKNSGDKPGSSETPKALSDIEKSTAGKTDSEKPTHDTTGADKPTQGKSEGQNDVAPSVPSGQTNLKPSEGSVFGRQEVKESKLSECLVPLSTDSGTQNTKEQSEKIVSAASDLDKPGPSGLQQAADISQPGPSGLQQQPASDKPSTGPSGLQQQPASDKPSTSVAGLPPVDSDKPGPSGLQPEDIPSTSGDAGVAMEVEGEGDGEGNQLISSGVKVTGSSVWTPVQSSDMPSTSAPETRQLNIPPPAVCQANLMEHIQTMHEELFDRLALIEEQIEALEIAYAQKQGAASSPQLGSEQESALLKRKMAVLLADLEKLSNIDLTNHN